ncbi:amidase domain-containing protein [Streptomyces sp. NPDC048445]|uniref:amidase domain-containing protein n=1 Tax=Streptomyces sp. NPDC048445 TaxID=3365553 RepID=UPI0037194E14
MHRRRRSIRRTVVLAVAVLSLGVSAVPALAEAPPAPDIQAMTDTTRAFLAERTYALLDAPAPARADTHGITAVSGLRHTHDVALAAITARKEKLKSLGESYSAADVRISVDKVVRRPDAVRLYVTELTALTYAHVNAKDPQTKFTSHHEVDFSRAAGGQWQMTKQHRVDEGGPAPINDVGDPVDRAKSDRTEAGQVKALGPAAAGSRAATARPAALTHQSKPAKLSGGYDYAAMTNYAQSYAIGRNTWYRDFGSNDCTNFISQALRAGGWADEANGPYPSNDQNSWWYNPWDIHHQTLTWINAHWFYFYASYWSGRTTLLDNVWYMGDGDVLQADWQANGQEIDHTMMMTWYYDGIGPALSYHSNDTINRSLQSLLVANPNAWWWLHRT